MQKMGDFYLGLYDVAKDIVVSERVYKLDEYSSELYKDYTLIGEAIKEIGLEPELQDFKIDTKNVCELASQEYVSQKNKGKLTHETYPVYLRGTSHWKTKAE